MSTESPVGNRPFHLEAKSKCPTAQPLVSEMLAEGAKPSDTTKELQAIRRIRC